METVIVTRHSALVEYLLAEGIVPKNTPVVSHATPEVVEGKHVFGVLPLHLAALAAKVTEIPLALTPEMRGKELTLQDMQQIAGVPTTYKVLDVDGMRAVDDSCWGTGNQPFYGFY